MSEAEAMQIYSDHCRALSPHVCSSEQLAKARETFPTFFRTVGMLDKKVDEAFARVPGGGISAGEFSSTVMEFRNEWYRIFNLIKRRIP